MEIHDFIQLLETRTGKTKKIGAGYSACCPAHDDTTPSLSVSEGTDRKILLKCFSGCSVEVICASLGIKTADLFSEKISSGRPLSKRIEYRYQDAQGRLLFSKIRIEPGFDGKKKGFYWEQIDEHGETVKNLKGCQKVLYHLPDLLKAIENEKTIFLVEGEKDAEKLIQYGLTATTAPESLHWDKAFTELLRKADVVILYDLDKIGLQRKDLLSKSLYQQVKRLRIVDLPGLEYQESHGKDVSDWLLQGNTTSQLLEIVANTNDYIPAPEVSQKGKIRAVSINEFLNMELPKQEMLLTPFLPTQGLCLLYAKRGVGKTHVALGIAYAVASGGQFFKWKAPCPRKVLYIDGEMPAVTMQERLRRIFVSQDIPLANPDFLQLITPDLQADALPDISTPEGRYALESFIKDRDLIIIDNISTLFRSGVENEAESWRPVQDWALELRRKGKSVLFVHHAGKAGQQRGTSKKEDILDTVIVLKQPSNYKADQGACFEVTFEKTRHFAGEDAASFKATLNEQDDGLWQWEITETNSDPEVLTVSQLTNAGFTIQKIMDETGLTKSQVETKRKKAKTQGLI